MTVKNTIDGVPLWLLARPEHINSLYDAQVPYLLINKYDSEFTSTLVPTHKLDDILFNPKIIRDFCGPDTMAIQIKKSHRNNMGFITLGRSEESDIVVMRKEISKTHCGFYYLKNKWHVIDLHSTNGTMVNGQRVENRKLSSQSILSFGNQINAAFISPIDLGMLVAEMKEFKKTPAGVV